MRIEPCLRAWTFTHLAQWHPLSSGSPPTLTAFVGVESPSLHSASPSWPQCKSRVLFAMSSLSIPVLRYSFRPTTFVRPTTSCFGIRRGGNAISDVSDRDPDQLKVAHQVKTLLDPFGLSPPYICLFKGKKGASPREFPILTLNVGQDPGHTERDCPFTVMRGTSRSIFFGKRWLVH